MKKISRGQVFPLFSSGFFAFSNICSVNVWTFHIISDGAGTNRPIQWMVLLISYWKICTQTKHARKVISADCIIGEKNTQASYFVGIIKFSQKNDQEKVTLAVPEQMNRRIIYIYEKSYFSLHRLYCVSWITFAATMKTDHAWIILSASGFIICLSFPDERLLLVSMYPNWTEMSRQIHSFRVIIYRADMLKGLYIFSLLSARKFGLWINGMKTTCLFQPAPGVIQPVRPRHHDSGFECWMQPWLLFQLISVSLVIEGFNSSYSFRPFGTESREISESAD